MKDYFKSVITGDGSPCRMKRLANGDKSTNEIRILERARFWKSVLFRGGTIVNDVNASMPLVSYVNDYNGIKVWFEDTLDVFPCNYKGVLASLILSLISRQVFGILLGRPQVHQQDEGAGATPPDPKLQVEPSSQEVSRLATSRAVLQRVERRHEGPASVLHRG